MDRGEDGQRRGTNVRSRTVGRPASQRLPVRNLAGKLQLTRLALGCSTQKELVARFAAVNPATAFTAQNAYKWLGGKAMPRVSSVYEDWAQLLGGWIAAPFIAACSFEEFALALREHLDIPEAAIRAVRSEATGAPAPDAPETLEPASEPVAARSAENGAALASHPAGRGRFNLGRGGPLLKGSFLAISLAWSHAQSGRLILGATRIEDRGEDGLAMDYVERVLGRIVPFAGPVVADSQAVQSVLECQPTGRLYFLSLQFPVFPANLVGGLLCGTVLHDPEIRSVASRFLLVRNHVLDWDGLVAHSGYVDLSAEGLVGALAALGYEGGAVDDVADHIVRFLRPVGAEAIQVGSPDIGTLGGALDLLAIANP